MNATVDIYNQEQITAALGQIKTALDSLISAGIPVDLTGYVRTEHTGDIEVDGQMDVSGFVNCAGGLLDGDVNIGNDLIVDGDISGGDLEVATLTVDEASHTIGVVASFGGEIEVTDGSGGQLWRVNDAGLIGYVITTATISGDTIAAKSSLMQVDVESGVVDDLKTITGGTDGDILWIFQANSGRDITIKHATGNILTNGAADFTMPSVTAHIGFLYHGGFWIEIGRRS